MTGQVYGYLRVSTDAQADSGAGLEAQRIAIQAEADRRGWQSVEWVEDAGWSGKNLERPGIAALLPRLRAGDTLVVSKLDRLSRSLVAFAHMMEDAKKRRWSVIALDLGIDMTTPAGRMIAGVMASLAEWEREVIAERTRSAMQARKAQGGIRYGHRSRVPMQVQQRVEALWLTGLSMCEIARRMTAQGVLTVEGCPQWHASTVSTVLSSLANDRLAGLIA
jgi:DNA invertase Pin-like site-specific DNA recombinase